MPARTLAKQSTTSLKADRPNQARLGPSRQVATLAILLAVPAFAAGAQADPIAVQPPEPSLGPEDLQRILALTLAYIESFDPNDNATVLTTNTATFLRALMPVTGYVCLETIGPGLYLIGYYTLGTEEIALIIPEYNVRGNYVGSARLTINLKGLAHCGLILPSLVTI